MTPKPPLYALTKDALYEMLSEDHEAILSLIEQERVLGPLFHHLYTHLDANRSLHLTTFLGGWMLALKDSEGPEEVAHIMFDGATAGAFYALATLAIHKAKDQHNEQGEA